MVVGAGGLIWRMGTCHLPATRDTTTRIIQKIIAVYH